MIDGHKVLGLIPARGGSKGIPRKNIRPLGGKPLIAWTIEVARNSQYIDRLVVSTDDQEIADTVRKWGADVPFMRPAELASDTARGIDVVLHALRELPEYDVVVLLQPTSPFRTVTDVDGAVSLWKKCGETVVGVTEARKSPYWMYLLDEEGRLQSLLTKAGETTNRRELPPAYALNGAVYVAGHQELQEQQTFLTPMSRGYEMPRERSIDLDSEEDWEYAEWMIERSGQRRE